MKMGLECVLYGDERLRRGLHHEEGRVQLSGTATAACGNLEGVLLDPAFWFITVHFLNIGCWKLCSNCLMWVIYEAISAPPLQLILQCPCSSFYCQPVSFAFITISSPPRLSRNIHISKKTKPISALIHETVEETKTGVNMPSNYPSLVVC